MHRALLLLLLLITGCVSKGDVSIKEGEGGGGAAPTCTDVCGYLQAETFNDCAKWTDYQDCIGECADHAPTDAGLQCAIDAETCPDFQQCDSDFDLF